MQSHHITECPKHITHLLCSPFHGPFIATYEEIQPFRVHHYSCHNHFSFFTITDTTPNHIIMANTGNQMDQGMSVTHGNGEIQSNYFPKPNVVIGDQLAKDATHKHFSSKPYRDCPCTFDSLDGITQK